MKSHANHVVLTEAIDYVANHFETYEGFKWWFKGHRDYFEDGQHVRVILITTQYEDDHIFPAEFSVWFEDCIDGLYGEW